MTWASTYSEPGRESGQEPGLTAQEQREAENALALNGLPDHPPPSLEERCLLHGRSVEAEPLVIIVSQAALGHIAAHSYSNLGCEVGGALLGKAYQHEGRVYVQISAALPAVTADHGPVHFTFTADAWSQLHRDREQRFPGLEIVGWFHTHPDLGVFYSSDDVVVHSAAFTMPWHVGMVVDPVRKETSFFGWRDEGLAPILAFYELCDRQPRSKLEWRPVATSVWDYPYGQQPSVPASSVYLHPSGRPTITTLKPYLGFAVGAFGLLLAAFTLVAWVLPLTREVERLQNTVILLADTALADSNAATCPDPFLRVLAPLNRQRVQIGSVVELVGTAMIEEAAAYEVNSRLAGTEPWTLVGRHRRDVRLGELAAWNTASLAAGMHELRLTAVDRNNVRLSGSPPCVVAVELIP